MSESTGKATLVRWHKSPGDSIQRDELLLEIETDKVVLDVYAAADGVLLLAQKGAGSEVTAGEVVGRIGPGPAQAPEPIPPPADAAAAPAMPSAPGAAAAPAAPAARQIERVPMSRMRERIAERMLQAQSSSVIVTTVNEIDMQPATLLRDEIQGWVAHEHGLALGWMAFFVKAAVAALARYPILNAAVEGSEIVYHKFVDVGIAVSSSRGLVVPVMRDVQAMSLIEIEERIKQLAAKAQQSRLTLEDITGGTFSITNGGVFGSLLSTPVLNPPQSAILGLHAVADRMVVVDGQPVVRPMCYVALSYDHRIIDGREAALALGVIKEVMEDPQQMLDEGQLEAARAFIARPFPAVQRSSPPPRAARSQPAEEAAMPLQALRDRLQHSLAEQLGVALHTIDPATPFVEMGLGSAGVVQWVAAVNRVHGTFVQPTMAYAYPNLTLFAEFLWRKLRRAGNTPLPAGPAQVAAMPPGAAGERIAVVGMSGRYPGAPDLNAHWKNLAQGRDLVTEVPAWRWNVAQYYDPQPGQPGKTSSKWLGSIDGVEGFDPLFFGISPADAELMDPQQRLFLQEAYRAFEDAGYAPRSLGHVACGVYLGLCNNDYALLLRERDRFADRLGNSCAIASARISYHLDLQGPAITIDTACSSSLVAVHLASQALLSGELDLALAGGVTLYLAPELHVCMSENGMLAPDGRCKSFDDSANGFVPGEGVGAVVLKRLSDALRDGDNVLGVICGSGINQDGKTNGITAPSVTRQTELVRSIYDKHGIEAGTITCLEAHGTGTKLGDPIELEAIAEAFRKDTERTQFCAIGSVKSNIGHTTAAAGVAGMHKLLLSLRHRALAPSLHFRSPNQHFDFDASPFFVNTQLRPWASPDGTPLRGALSSFGVSGTNAHLVLQEHVPVPSKGGTRGDALIVLSARSEERLKRVAERLALHLAERPGTRLADVAFTLQVGRDALDHRLALVVPSVEALVGTLRQFAGGTMPERAWSGRAKRRAALPGDAQQPRDPSLEALAQAWVKGVHVDWRPLRAGDAGRISLPTYPFAADAYWRPLRADQAPPEPAGRMPAAASEAIDEAFFERICREVAQQTLSVESAIAHLQDPVQH